MTRSAVHRGGGIVKIHIDGRDHCKHYSLYVMADLLIGSIGAIPKSNAIGAIPCSNAIYEEGFALINTLHALEGMADSSDDDE